MTRFLRVALRLYVFCLMLPLVGCGTRDQTVTFMSRKLYGGADDELAVAFRAMTKEQFALGIEGFHQGILMRVFPSRAQLIADEIKDAKPDFLGLQEALVVRIQTPADGPAMPATQVELDFTQILLDALSARGENYQVAAKQPGVDVEFAGTTSDVRYTENSVILARSDLAERNLTIANPGGGDFQTTCVLPSLGGPISIKRGWAAVDVTAGGTLFRLITSHLDFTCSPFNVKIQTGQGDELIREAKSHESVVVIVDLNSNADTSGVTTNPLTTTPTYGNFRNAGFRDGWTGEKGFNCCFPDDLRNPAATLDQRIDTVLYQGPFIPDAAGLTGTAKQTPEGYWASNHPGTWVRLKL